MTFAARRTRREGGPVHRLRCLRAYTLIELTLVIALLGLAGALLVPQMIGQDSMSVQAAVRKVIGDLQFAQSDAVAHQEMRRVHFFADGSGYAIVRVDESNFTDAFDGTTADYVNDPLGGPGTLGRFIVDFTADPRYVDVWISEVDIDSGGRDIVYDRLGGTIQAGSVPGTGGRIVLESGDYQYELLVSGFTGKLTVNRIAP